MVAQERGSVIPGFPPQIFTDSQMPKLLQKVWGRLSCAVLGLCRAQCWADGTQFPLFGVFLSGGSVFLFIWDFSGVLLTKDHFLQLVRDPSGVAHFVG